MDTPAAASATAHTAPHENRTSTLPAQSHARAYALDSTTTAPAPTPPPCTVATLNRLLYDCGIRPSGAQVARIYAALLPYIGTPVATAPLDRDTWQASLLVPGIDAARVAALRTYGQSRGYLTPAKRESKPTTARVIDNPLTAP